MSADDDPPAVRPPAAPPSARSLWSDCTNWRDLVIEQLADELAEMTDRAVRAHADQELWRAMTRVALGQAARTMAQLQEARLEIDRLRAAERRARARAKRCVA